MMVGILVVLMITVSMVGVLNSNVRAFDTNPQPFGYIPDSDGGGATYDVYGVAWNTAGTHAMMVGDNYATDLNWYNQTITNISGLTSGDTLNDVCYDDTSGKFYAVGNSTSGLAAYEWVPGKASMTPISFQEGTGGTGGDTFKKVAMGDKGFLAVGTKDNAPLAKYYNISANSWNDVSFDGSPSGQSAKAVSFVNGYFFIFVNASGSTDMYQISESNAASGTGSATSGVTLDFTVNDAASNGDDITVVGYNSASTNGTIFTFNASDITGPSVFVTVTNNQTEATTNLKGIAWDPTGSWATIVGLDDSYGPVVYSYYVRARYAAKLPYNRTDSTLAVAIRPPHSPASSTIAGSGSGGATTLSTTTASQPVTANTVYPHIDYIDIYDNSSNSYMNRQMDVDEGSATDEFYNVTVNASYGDDASGLDWNDINTVDVYAWFDQGNTGVDGYDKNEPANAKENIQFHFRYVCNSGDPTFSLIYPTTGEVQFFGGSDFAFDKYHHLLNFSFAPQQQVHNGSAGREGGNDAPNNRYNSSGTWKSEDQSNISALNDPYTWDMHVHVESTNGSASADAYDEFGIYKFTDLGSWSIPGDLSASAAPNTPNVPLKESGVNTTFNLTYRSNCDYRIRVYMDDDLRSGTTSDVIPATKIAVMGGTLSSSTHFSGTGDSNALYIVGQSATVSPFPYGTSTNTTQVGGALKWTVDIPTVAEASYTANAVYVISHP